MKHIRRRINKPNLCGTTDMPYLTVRAARIRRRDGHTDDLCPRCLAALAGLSDPPTRAGMVQRGLPYIPSAPLRLFED